MTKYFFSLLILSISCIACATSIQTRKKSGPKTIKAVESKESEKKLSEEVIEKGKLRIETHTGVAYLDSAKKEPIYTEKHTATFRGKKLQSSTNDYFDLSGNKIAELNSDYSKSILMPTYVFRDLRNGAEEGFRFSKGKYVIFRKKPGEEEEVYPLEETEKVFSCQGWHYHLINNLDLVQSNDLQMKLIFPSKLDYYSFRARSLEPSDSNILKIRLEFKSWFIRLFAPHLDITYDKSKKKIINYYGPSNILDDSGEVQNVYIFYE